MKAGRRLGSWVFGVVIVAALPAFGSTNVAAASTAAPATRSAPSTHSSHTSPFFPLTANHRGVAGSRTLKRGGSVPVSRLARGSAGAGLRVGGGAAALPHSPRTAPLVGSTTPNTLVSFPGTAQETAISAFGNDQQVTPPNEDVAASSFGSRRGRQLHHLCLQQVRHRHTGWCRPQRLHERSLWLPQQRSSRSFTTPVRDDSG